MDERSLHALWVAFGLLLGALALYLAGLAGVASLDTRSPVVCHSVTEDGPMDGATNSWKP